MPKKKTTPKGITSVSQEELYAFMAGIVVAVSIFTILSIFSPVM